MAIAKHKDKAYAYADEIQELVLRHHPEAKFRITPIPDDNEGVAVWAYTAADDDEINSLVADREFELSQKDVYILTIPMPLEAWEN